MSVSPTTNIELFQEVPSQVRSAVRVASDRSGVDFSYLLANAALESGFRADAKASTSSATGLFQFVEGTWLDMVRAHGAKYGLADQAAAIAEGGMSTGKREEILELRNDPRLSALMAAEYTSANQRHLESAVGGEIDGADLYLAHFLGAGGASRFLTAMGEDESQSAASLFPQAARANRAIFYDGDRPRSLAEVRGRFAAKLAPATMLANAAPAKAPEPPAPASWPATAHTMVSYARSPAPAWRATADTLFPPPLALETQLYLAALELPDATRPRT